MARGCFFFTGIAVALCLGAPTAAQTTAQELWRDVLGLHVMSAKMTADGDTLFTGYDTWDGNGFAVVLDPSGNRTVLGTSGWYVGDVAADTAGNLYSIWRGYDFPGGRVYVQRLGAGGWTIQIDHPVDEPAGEYRQDWPLALELAPDGNLVAGVRIEDCNTNGCQGTSRGFVAKYDPTDGSELWQQVSTVSGPPRDLALDAAGNVLLTGSPGTVKYSAAGAFVCSHPESGWAVDAAPGGAFYVAAREYGDVELFRYDSGCAVEWNDRSEWFEDDDPVDVVATSDGGAYVLGDGLNEDSIARYTAGGTRSWERSFYERTVRIDADASGDAYVAKGHFSGTEIARHAVADGAEQWEVTLDLGNDPFALMIDSDDEVVVVLEGGTTIRFTQVPDFDGDGVPNVDDNCPLDANPGQEDGDDDDVGDVCDNCPAVVNADQADVDTDEVGDLCDNCSANANPGQEDVDIDTVGDLCDNCPAVSNTAQTDADADGAGDACDNCVDVPNAPLIGTCIAGGIGNLCATHAACGPGGTCSESQEDADGDGLGDACQNDDDRDGVGDAQDNCRTLFNPGQQDTDGDGIGDACNGSIDADGDGWSDPLDNCPGASNVDQADANDNAIGDACEYDLSIARVELVQVVQDEQNSVPLIGGKDTWIRVYLDVGQAGVPIGPVTGSINFQYASEDPMFTFVNGFAQVKVVVPEESITAPPVPDQKRTEDTLIFHIPGSWSWDDTPHLNIHVRIEGGAVTDVDPFNNRTIVPMTLVPMPPLSLQFVPVYGCAFPPVPGVCDEPTANDFRAMIPHVRRLFPVSKIRFKRSEKIWQLSDPTENFPQGAGLYNQLWWVNLFTDDYWDDMKYVGVVCTELDPVGAGVLSGGGQSGMGWGDQAWMIRSDINTDRTLGGELLAHELGHTLLGNDEWHPSRPGHVKDECNAGTPHFDDYPVSNPLGLIDGWGFDGERVYAPDSHYDLMTYAPCEGSYSDCVGGQVGGGICTTDADCTTSGTCLNDRCNGGSFNWNPCESDADCSASGSCTGSACVYSRDGLPCAVPEDCGDGWCSGQWISAYIYKQLIGELWSLSQAPESAPRLPDEEYLAAAGTIRDGTIVESRTMHRVMLPGGTSDGPGSGLYSIELQDATGTPLFTRLFELGGYVPTGAPGETMPFSELLPFDPATTQIVIRHDLLTLEVIPISAHTPVVMLIAPNGGESLSGTTTISWSGSDDDLDPLLYEVLYSTDGGAGWTALASGLDATSYLWDTDTAGGSDSALIKVVATDGVNSGEDGSDATFTVVNKPPTAAISDPADSSSFFRGREIAFAGSAFDLAEGSLEDGALSWSSSLDGLLATGGEITRDDLSAGDHLITLTAQDTPGATGTDTITITVVDDIDSDGDLVGDTVDNCVDAVNPDQLDGDGDGAGDACDIDDPDGDGYVDYLDNCPDVHNAQLDADGDGVGDACDNCVGLANAKQDDADQDGHGDLCDCSPQDPTVRPGAVEICNGTDDDCDDAIDEDCVTVCASATAWDPATRVTHEIGSPVFPEMIWNGTQFGVAWHALTGPNLYDAFFTRLSATGAPLGSVVNLSNAAGQSSLPALAWTGAEFGVAWYDNRDGNFEIYFTRLDAQGAPIGSPIRVTDHPGSSLFPDLLWIGDRYTLVWTDTTEGARHLYFLQLDALGQPLGAVQRVSDAGSVTYNPVLLRTGSEYALVWEDLRHGPREIYFARVDASGAKIGSDVRVTEAGASQRPAMVDNGAGYGLVWEDDRDGEWEIYFARLHVDGSKVAPETRLTDDATTPSYPTISWSGSDYAVAWGAYATGINDIFLATLDPHGNVAGSALGLTNLPTGSVAPALVWSGDAYGVVWHDYRHGSKEIYFSRAGCCGDGDADGYLACAGDCDDRDALRNPGQAETCDGLDTDCDGILPTDEFDLDADGAMACGGDCDDSDAAVYADAPEVNDGRDNQCPGSTGAGLSDELSGPTSFIDADTLSWEAQAGATQYEVARSGDPTFVAECQVWSTSAATFVDSQTPGAGVAWFYLVHPVSPHYGDWGSDSDGVARDLACIP